MADQAERDGGNGERPSGSALNVRTAGGTEISINDPWTARITMVAAIYMVKTLASFFKENPEVVKSALQLVFKPLGAVISQVSPGSLNVDLNFGSKEQFLKFEKDFQDGKVKDAIEEEFRKIGYDTKLNLTLIKETPNVATIEMRKESTVIETKKITFENPDPEVESHGKRKAEKEGNEKPEEKQEEESASAAKKPKIDSGVKPETSNSGVSSASKKKVIMKVKKGNPKNKELEQLAEEIDPSDWKRVARGLKIDEPKITAIDKENAEFYEKKYKMLLHWKQKNGRDASWEKLYQALVDADLKELVEKHCSEEMTEHSV